LRGPAPSLPMRLRLSYRALEVVSGTPSSRKHRPRRVVALECHAVVHQCTPPELDTRCTGQCKQGYCSTGIRRLAQLPGQITCRKFLILQCQPEPHSGAHKQKISGRLNKGALRKVIWIHRKAIPGGLFAALYFLAHQTLRRTMRFGDDSSRADVRRILSPRFRLR
jgi:hypothetical protein